MNVLRVCMEKISIKYLLIFLPFVFLFNQWSSKELLVWYGKSLYPVPYFEGQLSFSAERLMNYYNYMLERDSLNIYFQTQLFDFVFIVSTMLLFGSLGLLFYKLYSKITFLRRFSFVVLIMGLLAPFFDILENLISFYFISNPENIPNVLAVIYSTFAAIKFGLFSTTYLGLGFLVLAGIWVLIRRVMTKNKNK